MGRMGTEPGAASQQQARAYSRTEDQSNRMDAIRKKMQTMKVETDDLYKKIEDMEQFTKDTNKESDKFDADIRDASKKVQKQETSLEETMEKLQQSASKMEEAEKEFKDKDDDVNAAARRCVLMEEEVRINTEKLASTVLKLANTSKDADKIVKGMGEWENKTMNNEVEIEELDKNMRSARSIGTDYEMKYDNLARSLAMMEDELKRAEERVKSAESKVVVIEDELGTIGENQKQLRFPRRRPGR